MDGTWKCDCGCVNDGNYCTNCGKRRPFDIYGRDTLQKESLQEGIYRQMPTYPQQETSNEIGEYRLGLKAMTASGWMFLLALACSLSAIFFLLQATTTSKSLEATFGFIVYTILGISLFVLWITGYNKKKEISFGAIRAIKGLLLTIFILFAALLSLVFFFLLMISGFGMSIVFVIFGIILLLLIIYYIVIVKIIYDIPYRWKGYAGEKGLRWVATVMFIIAFFATLWTIAFGHESAQTLPNPVEDTQYADLYPVETLQEAIWISKVLNALNAFMHLIGGILAMKYHRLVQKTAKPL